MLNEWYSIFTIPISNWPGGVVAQPHLPSKPGGYPFYFAHDPTHFAEETGEGIIYLHLPPKPPKCIGK